MRRIDWTSAIVMVGAAVMAAAIPGLFAFRIYGHELRRLGHEVLPTLIG